MIIFYIDPISIQEIKHLFLGSPLGEIGTNRCLLPFPSTLMKPSSKYKSDRF